MYILMAIFYVASYVADLLIDVCPRQKWEIVKI